MSKTLFYTYYNTTLYSQLVIVYTNMIMAKYIFVFTVVKTYCNNQKIKIIKKNLVQRVNSRLLIIFFFF